MRKRQCSLALFLLVCLGLTAPAHSISFNIVPDVKKCLREEIHKDVLVVGEYKLSDIAGQKTDIAVCSQGGIGNVCGYI